VGGKEHIDSEEVSNVGKGMEEGIQRRLKALATALQLKTKFRRGEDEGLATPSRKKEPE